MITYSDYDYDTVQLGAEALSKEYNMSMEDTILLIIEEKIPLAIEQITVDMLACTDRADMEYMISEMVRFKIFDMHYTKFAIDYLTPSER